MVLNLERNEVLHSFSPASSHFAVPSWPALTACHHGQGVALPTSSRTKQVRLLLDVLVLGSWTAATVSDVQRRIRVDSRHSSSTSASAHDVGRLHTYPNLDAGDLHPLMKFLVSFTTLRHRSSSTPQHVTSFVREVLYAQVRRVCFGEDLLHCELCRCAPPPVATSAGSRCASLCPALFCL